MTEEEISEEDYKNVRELRDKILNLLSEEPPITVDSVLEALVEATSLILLTQCSDSDSVVYGLSQVQSKLSQIVMFELLEGPVDEEGEKVEKEELH